MKQTRQNGFTLIEMLLVLSLLSVLILLTIPIQHHFIVKEEEKRFLEILQFDILAIQNLSLMTTDQVSIRFLSDHYIVLRSQQVLHKRTIPEDWEIKMNTMNQISFTSKGTIQQAGTITIKTNHSTYDFTCPPGKGRCYF